MISRSCLLVGIALCPVLFPMQVPAMEHLLDFTRMKAPAGLSQDADAVLGGGLWRGIRGGHGG